MKLNVSEKGGEGVAIFLTWSPIHCSKSYTTTNGLENFKVKI